ncbi:methyltransferase [Flavobacterium phage vB_FspS_morran9-1]|uniref:DNA methyltransferase n=11 Tax=Lillamyvirus TaxID=2843418 RepID=A0A6B9LNG3_9CAUD|nr:methyltransferase [Flavobacterium phage vB_FspS_lillamy9-1]YP_009854965.1 methyltransferase [Flavobacterium phage vB_FspS_morran9-1]YP_009855174.1 methyltransferase [Flavobacterium phage vB_FspS_sniff9-1]YP_009855247.1 methyltransferase [Flavobacterium phage vB_FspS_snork6-1]QHB39139.1 DNA methyltransferase [Flavobacterium phage vB_FspS_lillamy9-2]QHB39212.1 DNA methyltransferase [Flavobacterium phage vB_FspS_lillamy9-3]QHB39285.1 DNA methyltransferase [Flavobacterium phage vB_FspS_lillamy
MNLTDKITITNEDNMLLMARYPDNYFDLAIVDPPYGINAGKMTMGSGKHKFKQGKDWDNEIPSEEYFSELKRVSKNQIIWGGNYFPLPLNNNWIIWDKLNPNLSFSEAELAWCSINKNVRVFKRYSAMEDEDGKKQHPTQKPILLYKYCLDKYAKQGDKILDTHLGSGSIAIACHDYGFELTCCELDKEYYDKAVQRIKNHISQQKLF